LKTLRPSVVIDYKRIEKMDMSLDAAAAGGWDDEILIDVDAVIPSQNDQETTSMKDDSHSLGSASRDDSQPFSSSPDKSQGYDAVGSLFSYLTSGVRTVAESAVTK